jgi:hypothetical protein
MKIFNPNIQLEKADVSKKLKGKGHNAPNGMSFPELLKSSSALKSHSVQRPMESTHTVEIEALAPIQKEAASKGEETLSLLNRLVTILETQDMSDSSARSVADALSNNIEDIKLLKGRLDASDPLRKTLDEIGVVSLVEYIKITRGDYG